MSMKMEYESNDLKLLADETSRVSALDLYDDLFVNDNENGHCSSINEVNLEKKQLQEQNNLLSQQLSHAISSVDSLKEQNKALKENFTSLLETAKIELERKNKVISRLSGATTSKITTKPTNKQNGPTTQETISTSLKGKRFDPRTPPVKERSFHSSNGAAKSSDDPVNEEKNVWSRSTDPLGLQENTSVEPTSSSYSHQERDQMFPEKLRSTEDDVMTSSRMHTKYDRQIRRPKDEETNGYINKYSNEKRYENEREINAVSKREDRHYPHHAKDEMLRKDRHWSTSKDRRLRDPSRFTLEHEMHGRSKREPHERERRRRREDEGRTRHDSRDSGSYRYGTKRHDRNNPTGRSKEKDDRLSPARQPSPVSLTGARDLREKLQRKSNDRKRSSDVDQQSSRFSNKYNSHNKLEDSLHSEPLRRVADSSTDTKKPRYDLNILPTSDSSVIQTSVNRIRSVKDADKLLEAISGIRTSQNSNNETLSVKSVERTHPQSTCDETATNHITNIVSESVEAEASEDELIESAISPKKQAILNQNEQMNNGRFDMPGLDVYDLLDYDEDSLQAKIHHMGGKADVQQFKKQEPPTSQPTEITSKPQIKSPSNQEMLLSPKRRSPRILKNNISQDFSSKRSNQQIRSPAKILLPKIDKLLIPQAGQSVVQTEQPDKHPEIRSPKRKGKRAGTNHPLSPRGGRPLRSPHTSSNNKSPICRSPKAISKVSKSLMLCTEAKLNQIVTTNINEPSLEKEKEKSDVSGLTSLKDSQPIIPETVKYDLTPNLIATPMSSQIKTYPDSPSVQSIMDIGSEVIVECSNDSSHRFKDLSLEKPTISAAEFKITSSFATTLEKNIKSKAKKKISMKVKGKSASTANKLSLENTALRRSPRKLPRSKSATTNKQDESITSKKIRKSSKPLKRLRIESDSESENVETDVSENIALREDSPIQSKLKQIEVKPLEKTSHVEKIMEDEGGQLKPVHESEHPATLPINCISSDSVQTNESSLPALRRSKRRINSKRKFDSSPAIDSKKLKTEDKPEKIQSHNSVIDEIISTDTNVNTAKTNRGDPTTTKSDISTCLKSPVVTRESPLKIKSHSPKVVQKEASDSGVSDKSIILCNVSTSGELKHKDTNAMQEINEKQTEAEKSSPKVKKSCKVKKKNKEKVVKASVEVNSKANSVSSEMNKSAAEVVKTPDVACCSFMHYYRNASLQCLLHLSKDVLSARKSGHDSKQKSRLLWMESLEECQHRRKMRNRWISERSDDESIEDPACASPSKIPHCYKHEMTPSLSMVDFQQTSSCSWTINEESFINLTSIVKAVSPIKSTKKHEFTITKSDVNTVEIHKLQQACRKIMQSPSKYH